MSSWNSAECVGIEYIQERKYSFSLQLERRRNMVDFVMRFGNVDTGFTAAEVLKSMGYPVIYFIHDGITRSGKYIQYGTVEMVAPKRMIFES